MSSKILPRVTLILGGARSGKSRHAELLIESALGGALYDGATYLATAEALDDEMKARIAEHRARRGPVWRTVEEPLDLVGALTANADPARPILVDCLTLWLTNIMMADGDLNITYMNRSAIELFGHNEADFKKSLPNFNASTLVGTNIDIFHKNPEHQRGI